MLETNSTRTCLQWLRDLSQGPAAALIGKVTKEIDLYELDGSQIIDGQIVANALKVLVLADAPKKDKAPKQASKK